jgi:hypothetical protein
MNYQVKRFEGLDKSLLNGQELGPCSSQGPPGHTQRVIPRLTINRILFMHLTFDRPTFIQTSDTVTRKLRALSSVSVHLVKECLLDLKDSWQTNPWPFNANKSSRNEDGTGISPTPLTKQPPDLVSMITDHRKQNPFMLG